jgi:hypothetical protein
MSNHIPACPDLTEVQRRWVLAVLHNDESSTDEELVEYFSDSEWQTADEFLTAEQARYWVGRREEFRGKI